jgi:hypothetical protein
LTCRQSCGFFGLGLGDGVGVGLLVGVGVGVVVGVGLGVELASGDGLVLGVGLGSAAGLVLAAALGEGAGDVEGAEDAEGAGDAEGLAAAGEELRAKTASREMLSCCPVRAAVVAVAGRLAHGPDELAVAELAPAELMMASRYARAAAAWWEEPLPTMNSPTMRPKIVMAKATNRARRRITDTIFPPCRPARGYWPSPP